MWKLITWICFALAVVWGISTGIWSVGLTQEIAYSWIGEPQHFFIPFVDTHLLIAPVVPFYAIVVNGNWLPLLSIIICTGGTISFWKLAKMASSKAYPKSNHKLDNR